MEINKIFNQDCIEGMKELPDNSIDCCVTSPPYFGLRDYGHEGQIGLEDTPELFVAKMVEVFAEVKRILKPTGTLWLNLGDSYSGGKTGRDDTDADGRERLSKHGNTGYANKDINVHSPVKIRKPSMGFKPKDLIGIPWMTAFALRSSGWYLRQDIIWSKPPDARKCYRSLHKSA
jgi:DNA modification methylase